MRNNTKRLLRKQTAEKGVVQRIKKSGAAKIMSALPFQKFKKEEEEKDRKIRGFEDRLEEINNEKDGDGKEDFMTAEEYARSLRAIERGLDEIDSDE